MEMVRTLKQVGFHFELADGVDMVDPTSLTNKMTDLALQAVRLRVEQLNDFKQGVFNACLFWAARHGDVSIVPELLGAHEARNSTRLCAEINCTDEMRRTCLYLAAQNAHKPMVKLLLEHGADLEVADLNGTTALSAVSYLGHVDVADFLIEQGASYSTRDRIGMTPIHYAVFSGHLKVVALLCKKLSVRGKPGVDFAFEARSKLADLLLSKTRQFARFAWGSGMQSVPGISGGGQHARYQPRRVCCACVCVQVCVCVCVCVCRHVAHGSRCAIPKGMR